MFDTRNPYGPEYRNPLISRIVCTVFLNLVLAGSLFGSNAIVHHHVANRPQVVRWN